MRINWRSNPAPESVFSTCGLLRAQKNLRRVKMMNGSKDGKLMENRFPWEYFLYVTF